MATYYHPGVEIQADQGLQTLILMNPNLVGYSESSPSSQPAPNFFLLNSSAPSLGQLPPPPGMSVCPSQHEISPLYGYPPPHVGAREPPRAHQQQGLSLSLSHENSASLQEGKAAGSVLGSKYLKVTQELLEEVINVGDGTFKSNESPKKSTTTSDGQKEQRGKSGGGGSHGAELSAAERQEIQIRKAKLVTMLDEAEQRYRQYHHQMQIVISSFEQAAGIGSARTYTALALRTISKQFRCIKDAILSQIRVANKNLGEDDGSQSGKAEGSTTSRLKFIDHHLRQQRALQQLGMIQTNAWRPQRGLPERSVSILRAWLFEHFLHPYPKDSDKIVLAKQTGLTRSQVSNWFINARVRLWKPMIEEMYTEEFKVQDKNVSSDDKAHQDHQHNGKLSATQKKNSSAESQINSSQDQQNALPLISNSSASTTTFSRNPQTQPVFTLLGSSQMEGIPQDSPKRRRINEKELQFSTIVPGMGMDAKNDNENNEEILIKFGTEKQSKDSYPMMSDVAGFVASLGSYSIHEMGRFGSEQYQPGFHGNNGVSLTLGLPHCDNHSLSATSQGFLPTQTIQFSRTNDFGTMSSPNSHSNSTAYEGIDIQGRKGFAAQLLPDFVA